MSKKTTMDLIKILQTRYFKGTYNPETHYVNELNLLQTKEIIGLGGEQKLNDANTKVLVGISDFNGTQIPSDANGLISAISVEYGTHASETNAALIDYKTLKSEMPAWLLNSELVVKSKSVEQFRIRVSEIAPVDKPRTYQSEFAKELERTLKVVGGQDLELFLSTPSGATLASAKHYVRLNLYGLKFAARTI